MMQILGLIQVFIRRHLYTLSQVAPVINKYVNTAVLVAQSDSKCILVLTTLSLIQELSYC